MYLTEKQQSKAWELAAARHAMPSALSSREQREAFSRDMRRRVHVMARVSSAAFASEVKTAVDSYLAGDKSKPVLIAHLQGVLARLGYSPEHGFPGDAALGIPAAEPGSLQDLSSWKRLELILETEISLALGEVQKVRGDDPVSRALFPCWELVRVQTRRVPRGSIDSGSPGWGVRWVKCGGPDFTTDRGKTRMIALKGDPIWQALGDHSIYADAIGVDHPPFAFNSGMGWRGVSKLECQRLGIDVAPASEPAPAPIAALPPAPVNDQRLDLTVKQRLQALLERSRAITRRDAA